MEMYRTSSAGPSVRCNYKCGDDSSHPLHDHEVGKKVTGLMDDFSLMLLKKVRTAF
jgi:hypothetical protein